MYPNLNAEMARKGIKRKDLAVLFAGNPNQVTAKLNGKIGLSLKDCEKIRDTFFPDLTIDYLFKRNV